MLKSILPIFIFVSFSCSSAFAQDTLPNISVKDISGRIIISWKNNYGANISNINIQRSSDSLRNFTTIGTVLETMNRENGYVDNRATDNKMYYRVFVAFEGGRYFFSKSHKPVKDTVSTSTIPVAITPETPAEPVKPLAPKGFIPSRFVYTGKENNVIINLPEAGTKKYSIKFFDENESPVFEIHKLTEPYLIIEKVNFLHSGWFYFQLFENEVLLEKHKFYIAKDRKP